MPTSRRGSGAPVYTRIDTPCTPEEKAAFKRLTPERVAATTLAGDPITAKLTRAPGNDAPIGGLKVTTGSGWFAARPSGTENIYKIYAESFKDQPHLDRLVDEARNIVGTRPSDNRHSSDNVAIWSGGEVDLACSQMRKTGDERRISEDKGAQLNRLRIDGCNNFSSALVQYRRQPLPSFGVPMRRAIPAATAILVSFVLHLPAVHAQERSR